jgi:hypothetical protein
MDDDIEQLLMDKIDMRELMYASRGMLEEVLESFRVQCDEDDNLQYAYEVALEKIYAVIGKILSKSHRFSQYRSKTKIVPRGKKISQKEIDRCDFVIKMIHKNMICVYKNKINKVTGVFKRYDGHVSDEYKIKQPVRYTTVSVNDIFSQL